MLTEVIYIFVENPPFSSGKHVHEKYTPLKRKPTMWFPNRSDTNRHVQAQKRARSLKFRI